MSNQRAHHDYQRADKNRVLKLRKHGLTERAIAESMGISKAHVHAILAENKYSSEVKAWAESEGTNDAFLAEELRPNPPDGA